MEHEFLHYKNFDATHTRRISYLLITKNRGSRLDQCIKNLGRYITPNDELIVVDCASKDNTQDIILQNKNTVHIFLSEPDRSSPHGLNKAVLLAKGKYVILLFDDDTLRPEGVEQAVEVMEKHSEIDLLVCGGTKHFLVSNESRPFYYGPGMNYGLNVTHAFTYGTCGNGFFIRRNVFAKVGIFPVDAIAWDVIWFAQCIYHGGTIKFARINFFDHYISDDSISRIKRPQILAERFRFIRIYCTPEYLKEYRMRKDPRFRHMRYVKRMAKFASHAYRVVKKEGAQFLLQKVTARNQLKNRGQKKKTEPIWDGGFS